jgi:hypothetical protein
VYLVTAGILLAGFIALSAFFLTSGEEYSRYNNNWNGTSAFFDATYGKPEIWDPESLSSDSCRTLLLLAPTTEISVETYRSFLSRGNTIILVDEEGSSNPLLSGLSTSLRVVPGNLSSIDTAYDSPTMVRAYPMKAYPLLKDVSFLVLNNPAQVTGGESLVETSLFSWMDENGNSCADQGEVLSRHTVMARESVGIGELVVLADMSLFINGMVRENPRFLENIHTAPALCLDQMASGTASAEVLPSLLQLVKGTYIMKIAVVTIVILLYALLWERRHA